MWSRGITWWPLVRRGHGELVSNYLFISNEDLSERKDRFADTRNEVLSAKRELYCSGETDKIKNYLPKEKQYLTTESVPCHKRCKDIHYSGKHEKIIEEGEDGGTYRTQKKLFF